MTEAKPFAIKTVEEPLTGDFELPHGPFLYLSFDDIETRDQYAKLIAEFLTSKGARSKDVTIYRCFSDAEPRH